jgi:superfamily II DNA/RNA helicase
VKLGLAPELLQAVDDLGYTQPTLVQEKVHSAGDAGPMTPPTPRPSPT